jgi:hypothetical protein
MTTTSSDAPITLDQTVGPKGRLSVHLASAEIRIAGTSGEHLIVRTPSSGSLPDRVMIETTDDSVAIREHDSPLFRSGRKVVQLEIQMPAGGQAAVEIASGWLDVQGLTGEQRYRTASGEMRMVGIAGAIELSTVSGDATLELAGPSDLRIKSVSGDVAVSGGRLDALRIGTTSGDVRIDSPLVGRDRHTIETLSGDVSLVAASGIRVEARTVSGDLTSDLPHRSEGRMGRRTLIVGDGAIELAFRSVSGDLRIRDQRAVTPIATAPEPWSSGVPVPSSAPSVPAPGPATVPPARDDADLSDDAVETERMAVLRALEQGDLDVATAMERLAALDDMATTGDGEPAHE